MVPQETAALRDFGPAYDRYGSFTTEARKTKSPWYVRFPPKADKPTDVSLSLLSAIRVINAVQQISTGLRSYLGLWSVRWHTRASAALR
jgi:hypothetical protein